MKCGYDAGLAPGPCIDLIVHLGDCRTVSDSPPALNLGFLTVFQDPTGHLGGYLVTNGWGRPLEFRLTTAVQPTKVQAALYGPGLSDYVQSELIGKTLIEKTSTPPMLVVTDRPGTTAVRPFLNVPVIAVSLEADGPPPFGMLTMSHPRCRGSIVYPARHADDGPTIERLLNAVDSSVDLLEPFHRIRDAMSEARKTGGIARAAA